MPGWTSHGPNVSGLVEIDKASTTEDEHPYVHNFVGRSIKSTIYICTTTVAPFHSLKCYLFSIWVLRNEVYSHMCISMRTDVDVCNLFDQSLRGSQLFGQTKTHLIPFLGGSFPRIASSSKKQLVNNVTLW